MSEVLEQIAQMIETAEVREPVKAEAAAAAASTVGVIKPARRGRASISSSSGPVKELPDSCPVRTLGRCKDVFYYLDANNQLAEMADAKHTRLGIAGLFGNRIHWLHDNFPRINKSGDPDGWRPEQAAEALMTAASERGVWNPLDKVRGAGAWKGDSGELILHCGDAIWVGPSAHNTLGRWYDPGLVGRYVYPAYPAGPRPDDKAAAGGEEGVGYDLLELLKTWAFRRGEVDTQLLLGWIGAAIIGGALKWRPLVWLTGGKGTGKSTLHELIKSLMADSLVAVSDASAAGVWQKLGYATLPVAFDELEAEEDNRKTNNIIKLARQASSGGVVLRGGSDHKSAEFTARSCFLFSSILVPPLSPQDRSRIAILELDELPSGQKAPVLDADRFNGIGRQIRRRLADGWARFNDTLDLYRNALQNMGNSARAADQFGTLLACSDLLLYDTVPSEEEARAWAQKLDLSAAAERSDDERDEQRCISHLLSSVVDPYRNGGRTSVGDWICKAADMILGANAHDANAVLGTFGMKVITGKVSGQKFLAIANYHQGLSGLFMGTHWAGKSGSLGVWVQAMRRLPGAAPAKSVVWFSGHVGRATLIPLKSIITEAPPAYDSDQMADDL